MWIVDVTIDIMRIVDVTTSIIKCHSLVMVNSKSIYIKEITGLRHCVEWNYENNATSAAQRVSLF